MNEVMEAIRKAFTVPVPQARAFEVFTTGIGTWWPSEGHSLTGGEPVIEAGPGGRWYERAPDGSEREWGRVAEWEPPARVLLLWQLDPGFTYDPDPSRATEIEVRFTAEGPGATRVEFEHRGFEVHGDAGREMRESLGSTRGWSTVVGVYEATLGEWSSP